MTESSGSFELYNTAPNPMRVLNSDYKYDAAGGPSKFQTYQVTSSNGTSLNVAYTFPVDSRQILDSYMTETYNCVLTGAVAIGIVAAAVAVRPLVEGNIGPTPFCIDQATNTTTLTLNNIPFTFSPPDILTAMTTFNNPSDSMGYCATDILDIYADLPTIGGLTFDSQYASLKNPLLSYFSSTYKNIGRNATIQNLMYQDGAGDNFDNSTLAINAAATSRPIAIKFTITVPVLHPMLCVSPADSRGYIGLRNNVTLSRQFLANAGQQMLQYISSNALISIGTQPVLSFSSPPTLSYQVYNLNSYDVIPRKMYYDYSQFGQVITSAISPTSLIAAGMSEKPQINNISMSRIPKYIYIYADNTLSQAKTTSSSRTPGYQITNLNLSYSQGGQGLFSNMSAVQLYEEFGVKQGNVKAFCETGMINNVVSTTANNPNQTAIGGYGTVLRIPGEYLQADWSKYSVGSTLSATINVQATCVNLSASAQPIVLKFIACDHSVVEIDTESGITQILSPEYLSVRHVEELRREKREDSVVPMFGGLLKHLKSKLESVRGKLHGKGLAELEHKNDSYDSNEVVGFKGGKLIRKSDLVGRKCY